MVTHFFPFSQYSHQSSCLNVVPEPKTAAKKKPVKREKLEIGGGSGIVQDSAVKGLLNIITPSAADTKPKGVCLCMPISVRGSVCLYVRLSICVYVCLSVCTRMSVCMCTRLFICLCICLCSSVSVCVYLCVYVCIYVLCCVCVFTCVCVCV